MIVGLASIVCVLGISAASGGNLARLADVEIQGPVRDLVLDLGAAGEARLAGELLPGERLTAAVPLPLGSSSTRIAPDLRWSSGPDDATRGHVRFLGWREDRAGAEIEKLPAGLRARSRPPMSPPEVRLPHASLALLPALLVLGLALRRRAAASWLLASAGSAAVLALGWPKGDLRERQVTVLERDGDAAIEVSASWERADLPVSELESVLVQSSVENARIVWTGALSGPAAGSWRVAVRGAAILRLSPLIADPRDLRREGNEAFALAETWLREEGEWTPRGPWELGAPLPPARAGDPPPGWLAAGLPQGIPVVLGRAVSAGRPDEALWIRQSGI